MLKHVKLLFLLVVVRFRTLKCEIEGRVVGGNYARIQQFPHSVYLYVECDKGWTCGASILNQKIVLTAGHCVFECNVGDPKFHTIEAYVGHEDVTQTTTMRQVVDFRLHESYSDENVENDVAVLVLKNRLPLGAFVKRVILTRYWNAKVQNGYVAGWGIVKETHPQRTTVKLKSVNQRIRSNETCSVLGHLIEGMFCAGSMYGSDPHPASGDSGSAFVIKEIYQIGLVSFKLTSFPAMMVYTNVTFYYRWITWNSVLLFCQNQW